MNFRVSNQDVVVLNGGGSTPNTGHSSHYPVWLDEKGVEHIYLNGETPTPLANLNLKITRRETVIRR